MELNVDDWVMLKIDHIRTLRSCKMPSERKIGPFKIIEKNTPVTFRLDLKNLVRNIHDVFHVEKLDKVTRPREQQKSMGWNGS